MRRLLVAALVLSVSATSATLAAAPTPKQQIARIEAVTSQIRGLKPVHPVKVSLLADTAFNRAYTTYATSLSTDAEIEMDRRESVLLGELSPKDNLKKILLQGSVGQFAGFYDYQTTTLYVRDDGGRALGVDRHTIAHEYTHALQDQHFHLGTLLPDQFPLAYRNSDMVAAHHALTEGDAVNTEIAYIRQTYTRSELNALYREESQPATGPALPKILKRELYFPYTTGLAFVQALYALKGDSSVNAAYKRLPSSTYEIMYPKAYLQHWQPIEVALHGVQGFSDWQQIDDDVAGAEGYNDLLWQHLGAKKANAITHNYRGDRYIFLEKGTDDAMRLDSVWTDLTAARTARDGFIQALKNRFAKSHVGHTGPLWTVRGGGIAVALAVNGPHLTIAYASTPALAQQLEAAPAT